MVEWWLVVNINSTYYYNLIGYNSNEEVADMYDDDDYTEQMLQLLWRNVEHLLPRPTRPLHLQKPKLVTELSFAPAGPLHLACFLLDTFLLEHITLLVSDVERSLLVLVHSADEVFRNLEFFKLKQKLLQQLYTTWLMSTHVVYILYYCYERTR